jgi:glycosyltransferase involved in cell wall biosynthesis
LEVRTASPVLSVVVPTKGRPRYLERCLHALAGADYPRDRFEVVIANDGGGTEVERIVSSAGDRLAVELVEPERTGPSAARNAGAMSSRGEFIAFTDDDCEPAPRWLTALERALERNPGAAVGGETLNGAPHNKAAVASQLVVEAVHAHFNRDPAAPRFFASFNVAFPAQPFRALGGFDERLRYAEDREMCERWLGAGHRFTHAPGALVHHMRTLTLREFWGQHYGYGRGAWGFRRARETAAVHTADSGAVVAALLRSCIRTAGRDGPAVAGYLALSQVATAAGFGREAAAALLGLPASSMGFRQRSGS